MAIEWQSIDRVEAASHTAHLRGRSPFRVDPDLTASSRIADSLDSAAVIAAALNAAWRFPEPDLLPTAAP